MSPGSAALQREQVRRALRRPGDALSRACIGTVPILWNNVDQPDLAPAVDAAKVLDDIARTGYEGTQLGNGFPRGEALRAMLAERGLRLAEVYVSLPCSADGPADDALDVGRERLALLHEGGGDVLTLAILGSPERSRVSGRADAPDAPRLTDDAWARLASVVDVLAGEAVAAGHEAAFHQHAGTFIETPGEMDRLLELTDRQVLGVCFDLGHWTVAGGDPVAALRRYGRRVRHVHLKDVDAEVLADLRAGRIPDLDAAIRARLFTELGAGVLDLMGVLSVLAKRDYSGWLMVEQDSGWGPAAESAAIGRRVLAEALRQVGRAGAT
ncbi:MAG: sugar phosphate isomerase/epimerase [Chloroflexota bacterium]|nr:sugar phosphate isomerase/epimerase [Chloroflexota bacterium]